ncbi:co-chaperone GroES [Bdellovibrio sp. HCB274]|uniref:co-chaperone GroES n=1 Tax=Bdellovibrio sp. HCB274 TaxID=3394361 RepID=UPI0039B68D22
MAKKKSSAKKAVKKTVKKVVKKSASKVVKKASKKSPAKKASAKKTAVKKPAVKPAKKTVAKPVKKLAAKAATKKSAMAPAKKATPAKSTAPAIKQAIKPVAKKVVDLTDFVTPLDDRLMVQLSGAERTTASGLLYIPDTVADVSGNLHGTVVAVGRGHISKKGHLRPMELKVGDKVVFSQYSGSKINIQNEDLVILRETEVMGLVEK